MRHHSPVDHWIKQWDTALRTLWGQARAHRDSPAASIRPESLSPSEKKLAGALMRVNHVGEVCAQALYQAQALTSTTPALQSQFENAAREEEDHLAWTQQRLRALGAHTSHLNPLWYAGAFGLGCIAGKAGDDWSLGFVLETERQVEAHLASHLNRLPANDLQSRAVVNQMKADEAAHAHQAERGGARELPFVIRAMMRAAAKVMTSTAHWV